MDGRITNDHQELTPVTSFGGPSPTGYVPLGARGAGRSATCGKRLGTGEPAGQGAAFRRMSEVAIAIVTVVNAAGAIQPFHTTSDGDVPFSVTTSAVEDHDRLAGGSLGVIASELVWDAVLAAVPAADLA